MSLLVPGFSFSFVKTPTEGAPMQVTGSNKIHPPSFSQWTDTYVNHGLKTEKQRGLRAAHSPVGKQIRVSVS